MRLLQEVFSTLSEDKRVRNMYAQHAFAFSSITRTPNMRCLPKER